VIAFKQGRALGLGVIALNTKMIDKPMVERAQRTVRMARAMNVYPPSGNACEGCRMSYVENTAGRIVPTQFMDARWCHIRASANSCRKIVKPRAHSFVRAIFSDGNKVVSSLVNALQRAGLHDGMTISSHHHFRDGDLLMAQVFAAVQELGVRDLVWFPTAVFPSHEPLLKHLGSGLIHHIEGSLNGPIGRYASLGKCAAWRSCVRTAGAIARFKMVMCTLILR